jgi:NitT/TauT family transport system ATP-binding protein
VIGHDPTTALGGRVSVRDLRISYRRRGSDDVVALDGLSLEVEPGEVVALIGPNGSGKSTLLRAVAGLIEPAGGDVSVDGDRVLGPDPRIGLVFQEPRLLPWRTVAANVAYPLELAGVPGPERETRVAALVSRVGLEEAADRTSGRLSGGMRQRAALARGLALDPRVLLLDEPFSALDALTRERFNLELLEVWAEHGPTILLVTHSVQEAVLMADRVIVLSERPGRVLADIPVALPRPRRLAMLDEPTAANVARAVRGHLEGIAA